MRVARVATRRSGVFRSVGRDGVRPFFGNVMSVIIFVGSSLTVLFENKGTAVGLPRVTTAATPFTAFLVPFGNSADQATIR